MRLKIDFRIVATGVEILVECHKQIYNIAELKFSNKEDVVWNTEQDKVKERTSK